MFNSFGESAFLLLNFCTTCLVLGMMVKLQQLTKSNDELRKKNDLILHLLEAKSSTQSINSIWVQGDVFCESGSFIGNATGDVSLTGKKRRNTRVTKNRKAPEWVNSALIKPLNSMKSAWILFPYFIIFDWSVAAQCTKKHRQWIVQFLHVKYAKLYFGLEIALREMGMGKSNILEWELL